MPHVHAQARQLLSYKPSQQKKVRRVKQLHAGSALAGERAGQGATGCLLLQLLCFRVSVALVWHEIEILQV
jgi:hypothetical protein